MFTTRHSDMIKDINMNSKILVFGAGSIGSYTVLALAKLGFTDITVIDDGMVEEENIAPQFYRPRDLGKSKVECLVRSIREQTDTVIAGVKLRYTNETMNPFSDIFDVVIATLDSMKGRKDIIDNISELCPSSGIFIDARMAIEFLTIISMTNLVSNRIIYCKSLFDDNQAVQEPCTNKAISYTSFIAGGLIARQVLSMLKGNHKFTTINFDINSLDLVVLCQ